MAVALALGACAGSPQAENQQGMEFVWGCWVQKQAFDTNSIVFLRLLPNADRSAYEGQLLVYANNAPEQGGRVSFARDGSQATFFFDQEEKLGGMGARAPTPAGWPQRLPMRAFFTPQPAPHDEKTEYLVVEGSQERLIISITDRERADLRPFLDLERDGCD